MGFFCVLPVWRTVANMAVNDDQFGTVLYAERVGVSVGQRNQIVGIVNVLEKPPEEADLLNFVGAYA